MKRSVIGMAESTAEAQRVVDGLRAVGIPEREISVLYSGRQAEPEQARAHHSKAPEGAIAGASTGGVLGGTLGALLGWGIISIPCSGALVVAGPLLAALGGAAALAAMGGMTGALIGLGFSAGEAARYEHELRGGQILIAVQVENLVEQARAKKVLAQTGAHDLASAHTRPTLDNELRP